MVLQVDRVSVICLSGIAALGAEPVVVAAAAAVLAL